MINKLVNILSSSLRNRKVFIVALLIFGLMSSSFAQDRKVDINVLIQETQKMSQSPREMTIIWWIPEDFWQASFEQDPNMTQAQIEEFLKVLRSYMIVVAMDGKIGNFGGVTYKPESTIRNSVCLQKVEDKSGKKLREGFSSPIRLSHYSSKS